MHATDKLDAMLLAAGDAIAAAIRRAGPSVSIGDLVTAMLVIYQNGLPIGEAASRSSDMVADAVLVAIANLVGARRARQLLDDAINRGAGARFQ